MHLLREGLVDVSGLLAQLLHAVDGVLVLRHRLRRRLRHLAQVQQGLADVPSSGHPHRKVDLPQASMPSRAGHVRSRGPRWVDGQMVCMCGTRQSRGQRPACVRHSGTQAHREHAQVGALSGVEEQLAVRL